MNLARRFFDGDSGRIVRDIQMRLYLTLIRKLCVAVEREYRRAAKVVGIHDDVIRTLNGLDRRYSYERVEMIHDAIAACFRASLGEHPDQLALGEDADAMTSRLWGEWHRFFDEELGRFCSDSRFVRSVVLCILGQRYSDTGEDALRDATECIEPRLEECLILGSGDE